MFSPRSEGQLMNVRSALIVLITAPVASIALAQMYPTPQPKSNPAATLPSAASPATAETSSTPAQPAAAAAMPPVPPSGCVAPAYPGKSASDAKIKAFNSSYKEYG